ncbi:hypothetical protein D3C76_968960 [compost metagenome]
MPTNRLDLAAAAGFRRLRGEDIGVAGIHRVVVVEVIHRAQVGGDDAVLFLAAALAGHAAGHRRIVAGAHADDHRQRVGDAQAGGGVHALQASGGLAVKAGARGDEVVVVIHAIVPVGDREAVVGAELATQCRRAGHAIADHGAGVLGRPADGAAVVVADHRLVGTAEQLERAGQVDLRRLLGGVAGAVQTVQHGAAAVLVPIATVAAAPS